MKAKRPGFTDERYSETEYFFENGKSLFFKAFFSFFSLTHPSFWRLWTLPAKISGSHIFWHSGWSCASAFLNTCVVYVDVCPIRSDGIKFPPSSSYFKGRVRERERETNLFGLHHDECRDGIGAESPRWTMIPWLGCVKGGGVLRFGRPNWEKNQKIEGIVTRGRPTKQKKCRQGKKWSWTLSWIWIGYAEGVVGVKFSFFGWSSSSSSRNSVVWYYMTRWRWCLDCLVNDWANPNGW